MTGNHRFFFSYPNETETDNGTEKETEKDTENHTGNTHWNGGVGENRFRALRCTERRENGGFAPLLSYTLQLKFWKICAILYLRDVMC